MTDRIRVLIVDDDSDFRRLLRSIIESASVEIVECASGEEAITVLRSAPPQIAIVDVQLPGISGVELTKRISEEFPETLVGVISAHVDDEIVLGLVKAGAADILRKPFELSQVRQLMTRFLWSVNRRRSRLFRPEVLKQASLSLRLESNQRAILPAVHAISKLLAGLVDAQTLSVFELALHEILRNALEHGNLGISSAEKTHHYATGSYEAIVEKRCTEAQEAGREIRVSVELDRERISVAVEDDGGGFSWRELLKSGDSVEGSERLHGRGLYLVGKAFDEFAFNDIGNRITAVKKLS